MDFWEKFVDKMRYFLIPKKITCVPPLFLVLWKILHAGFIYAETDVHTHLRKSFLNERPSIWGGVSTPAMSRKVGARSMFKTMSSILQNIKQYNDQILIYYNNKIYLEDMKIKKKIIRTYL